jgi:hypothetical protein
MLRLSATLSKNVHTIIYFVSSSAFSDSPVNAFLLDWIRSCRRSRAALVLARLASISSLRMRSRCFSALALWICNAYHVSLVELFRYVFSTYMFNQRTLVLECITLAQVVEFVIKVLVDFACGPVLDKEPA